ncbi:MAG: glycosyltransferase, partial [Verrucomicrobiae bacterium]|nr:glycosyltransferase [Verrucomicrobiae bacterium]
VETHLAGLVREFKKRPEFKVYVCAYKPIVTAVREYRCCEADGNVEIRRWWWFGGNLFRKLEPWPVLLFLYVTPYFLLRALLFMLGHARRIDVIHVHGLNMAFVGWVLGAVFRKPVVMQTHAIYSFNPDSLFGKVARFTLSRMNRILTLSTPSREELLRLGVPASRVGDYRYWIDLERFKPAKKTSQSKFTVLFVGRLIDIKGASVVCALAERFPEVEFLIVGDGPDRARVEDAARRLPNLRYVGLVPNDQLPSYYQRADVTVVPSQYPEGFGRVIAESLACGTPVIASNVGGIPDAMDETVGILSAPDVGNFAVALRRMIEDRAFYERCCANAPAFAKRRFSAANAERIFEALQ